MARLYKLNIWITCLLITFAACSTDGQKTSQANEQRTFQHGSPGEITEDDLVKASLEGNTAMIKLALEAGMDVDRQDRNGRTALMLAAYNGHAGTIRYLLDNRADPNKTDAEGRTALVFAASGPNPQAMEALLRYGGDPDITDRIEKWTPLMWAAAEGNTEVVRLLLASGADATLRDKDGETALDFARSGGHAEAAALLVQEDNR